MYNRSILNYVQVDDLILNNMLRCATSDLYNIFNFVLFEQMSLCVYSLIFFKKKCARC
jgi:hypothetical protein